jgi:VIT1/CCC1 family predicted Fe2+/Mn2+ transporter
MRPQIVNGLVVAGLMIVAALALQWLRGLGVIPGDQEEMTHRGFNIMMGLIVVGMANVAPKQLRPLAETTCDAAREQARRRFSGLAIVVGGLLYTLAWAVAPLELALPLSVAALSGALVVVMAQCLLFVPRR